MIGDLLVYFEPLDPVDRFDSYQPVAQTPAEAAALSEWQGAQRALDRARRTEEARRNLELRREVYRTELDAGCSGAGAEVGFRRAERDFLAAERRTRPRRPGPVRLRGVPKLP